MQKIDIRPFKQKLRAQVKRWRSQLPPGQKMQMDERICARITGLREYTACHTLITYVSLPIEVDTHRLIARALADGKQVAVPRCVAGSRAMEFFLIGSMEDLAPQTFGVLEPVPAKCKLLRDFSASLCIVPALAYDYAGFRLGYGAGYYDRFLSGYDGPKVGVLYAKNLRGRLWRGRYDVPVDLIVTENRLFKPRSPQDRK